MNALIYGAMRAKDIKFSMTLSIYHTLSMHFIDFNCHAHRLENRLFSLEFAYKANY